jgi:hypothetical protein
MRTYTVTLSGGERADYVKPCDYAVTADSLAEAVRVALEYHLGGNDETEEQVWVERCRPGFHQCGFINDLREENA